MSFTTSMRFEVFTAVKTQIKVFWAMMLCSVAVGYQHFRGPCCLQLQQHGPSICWYPTATLHGILTKKTST
jgi:hypothetical protein